MNLIIFDIDGTLTNTQNIEDHCFKKAFWETLQIDIFSQEWDTLKNVTDWGIANEIYFKENQQDIPKSKLELFQYRFIELLKNKYQSESYLFKEVLGASLFFNQLILDSNYALAIATGSWSKSAKIKLESINVAYQGIPFSNSDNFISREEIILDAIRQSEEFYSINFDNIIYFGDGEWDYRTCLNIDVPFIGVDCNRNGKLKQLGAKHIINDFSNYDSILEIMKAVCNNR